MANISNSVVGTGLDIATTVSQLVAAERAAADARISRETLAATTKISAIGALKSALSTFQTALNTMKTADTFASRNVSLSKADIFTATATGSAAPGSYDIEVISLAQSQQLTSQAYSGGDSTVIGTGQLTIGSGAGSFTVNIDSTTSELASIRDAINNATGNTSVQATIIREANGSRLLLTSTKSGVGNNITVTQSGGDGGLAALAYDPANGVTGLSQLAAAQDAHIKVAGFDRYSSQNTITDALDGVTLDLKVATPGTTVKLNVTSNSLKVTEQVKKFVDSYNALQKTFAGLRSYNAETKAAGPMLGDSMLRGIENEMRQDLSNPIEGLTGDYTSLANIGVTKQADGTLKLDDAALTKAINADQKAVANLFTGEKGMATRLSEHIQTHLDTNSDIDSRSTALQSTLKRLDLDKAAIDARMDRVKKAYTQQFTALDTLIAQMQSTSSYLEQQLANLPGAAR